MDLDMKKKKIRKKYFSVGYFIIACILGLMGLSLTWLSDIVSVKDLNMLYECISKNGIALIFGSFFFAVSCYLWIYFFLNAILPPKKATLYLNKIYCEKAQFLNKKGREFVYFYDIDKNNLSEKTYYVVLKTHDDIYEILEETNDSWIPKEKDSYWLNYYSPMGKLENKFLLPIVYVILLLGILSILNLNGYNKIFGIIFSIIPMSAIIYDLVCKIKHKQSNDIEIDSTKNIIFHDSLRESILIVAASILFVIILKIFISADGFISRLIVLPFLLFTLCIFGFSLSKVFQKNRLEKIFLKCYLIIFLTCWFGCVLIATIIFFKQKEYYNILYTTPFWVSGFVLLYKLVIKNINK